MKGSPRPSASNPPPSQRGRKAFRRFSMGVVGALLLLTAIPCYSLPGEVLLDNCRKSFDDFYPMEGGVCWGYLLGVWNTQRQHQATGQLPPTICVQDQLTVGELTRAFLAWAEKAPDALHLDASECVLASLREAFPCPDSKR